MKLIMTFLTSILFANVASANCNLQQAIDLKTSNLFVYGNTVEGPIVLSDVVLDKKLKTEDIDPQFSDEPLLLDIFGIFWEDNDMNMVGTQIRPDVCGLSYGCASGAGFSYGYSGSKVSFAKQVTNSNGIKTYRTTDNHPHYIMKPSDVEHPKTETLLKLKGTKLLSAELTVPVYTVTVKEGVNYLSYTGSNETACILSGKLAAE